MNALSRHANFVRLRRAETYRAFCFTISSERFLTTAERSTTAGRLTLAVDGDVLPVWSEHPSADAHPNTPKPTFRMPCLRLPGTFRARSSTVKALSGGRIAGRAGAGGDPLTAASPATST